VRPHTRHNALATQLAMRVCAYFFAFFAPLLRSTWWSVCLRKGLARLLGINGFQLLHL